MSSFANYRDTSSDDEDEESSEHSTDSNVVAEKRPTKKKVAPKGKQTLKGRPKVISSSESDQSDESEDSEDSVVDTSQLSNNTADSTKARTSSAVGTSKKRNQSSSFNSSVASEVSSILVSNADESSSHHSSAALEASSIVHSHSGGSLSDHSVNSNHTNGSSDEEVVRGKSSKVKVIESHSDDTDKGDGSNNDTDENELSSPNASNNVSKVIESHSDNTDDNDDDRSNNDTDAKDLSSSKALKKVSKVIESHSDESSDDNTSHNDSSDEEFIARKTANVKKRVIESSDDENDESAAPEVSEFDEDEEERKIERRALSPSTRRSMGFPRRRTINPNESLAVSETVSDSDEDDEEESIGTSPEPPNANDNQSIQSTPAEDNRMSNYFNKSLLEKLSSTMSHTEINNSKMLDNSVVEKLNESDSVIHLPNKNEVYVISSSDDDDEEVHKVDSPLKPKTPKKLVQPTLANLISKTPQINPKEKPKKQHISQQVFSHKMMALENKRAELAKSKGVLVSVGHNLPDKGARLKIRLEELQQEVKLMAEEIAMCVVDEELTTRSFKANLSADVASPDPWKQIQEAANEIVPKYTGTVGLANFNAQKAMTLDRLKDLHGSMETCPNASILADEPSGLKISLMPHQRHALAWMQWRERQKPRGGILADDMGLGKTLTMISLILACNQAREANSGNESSDDEENVPPNDNGWTAKGKAQFHEGGTLVVCPASLIRQWEGEINNRIRGRQLDAHVYHGSNRAMKPRQLAKFDVVITTYNLASREAKNEDTLFRVKWDRVILDEAHIIRNHKAQTSIGVCKLRSKYRWTLTGTPIQNKEMDIYALLKFLKCSPFDDLQHYKRWIESKSAGSQQRLNTLIQTIMLRRTKAQLQEVGQLQGLPQKELRVIDFNLEKEEMMVYQRIMTFSRTLFSMYLHQRAERDTGSNYQHNPSQAAFLTVKDPTGEYQQMHQRVVQLTHGDGEVKAHVILLLLLRLRQICCHPGLIDAMLDDPDLQGDCHNASTESNPEIDLLSQLDKLTINPNDANGSKDGKAISKAFSNVLIRTNAVFNLDRASSKIRKVIEIIEEIYSDKEAYDKVIVVSQWTSVLNLLHTHLVKRGIETVRIAGDVPINSRNGIVVDFNKKSGGARVMLLSLTAGGVGLNLVGANHLILMDVHWNPQLEAQAQDRIFRVGQDKKVVIYKVIASGTIEERIKQLQDFKLNIASGVLTGVQTNRGSKLSIDDLKNLFEF